MISGPNSVLSQHFQSPQFQTSLCSDQDKALLLKWELRLSRIHRTPETKFSNKITYDYTTVKPQLATVAIKFFAVWLSWLSPIWHPLFRFIFMYRRSSASSATWKTVSSVNAKWLFCPLWHVAIHNGTLYGIVRAMMFCKSVVMVSFSFHLPRMNITHCCI